MKTNAEQLVLEEFCRQFGKACNTLGYDISFEYNNEREEVTAENAFGEIKVINVNMSSTRAVLIDLFNQLIPKLSDFA